VTIEHLDVFNGDMEELMATIKLTVRGIGFGDMTIEEYFGEN